MQTVDRTAASGKNLRAALLGQCLVTAANLVSRRLYLRLLGSAYLGLFGLCGHVLNVLTLFEPGFFAACSFALYEPLAAGDTQRVSQILAYLRRVLRRISLLTLGAGLLLLPFCTRLISPKEPVAGVRLVFFLSVLQLALSYRLSYRQILPLADQKGYLLTTYHTVFFLLTAFFRIVFLYFTGGFFAYLLVGLVCGVLEDVLLSRRIGKQYPYLSSRTPALEDAAKRRLGRQAKALFLRRLGSVAVGSMDNLAVFAFLGLSGGTRYSNYTMLLGACLSFLSLLCGAIGASVGDLGVRVGRVRMEQVYRTAFFIVFSAACYLSVTLFFLYPVVVRLWMGEAMVLGRAETALFCAVLFFGAVRMPTQVFCEGCGLFEKGRYKTLCEAAVCAVLTFSLAPRFGIAGVLIGQLGGMTAVSLWYEPYLLYRHGFRLSARHTLPDLARYALCLSGSLCLSSFLCRFTGESAPRDLLLRLALCTASFAAVFFVSFSGSKRLLLLPYYFRNLLTFPVRDTFQRERLR